MKKLRFLAATLAAVCFMAAATAAAPSLAGEKAAEAKKSDAKPFSVGFIYISSIGDGGWSYAHDLGRRAMEAAGITTAYVESVPEGADSERVLLNMARKGYDVIIATSFGYMDPVIKVAKDYPDTVFLHCSGYKTAPNVSAYFGRMYQARYLTGLVAGSMTKSDVIGYVAAFPLSEVIRGINAFTMGVRAVNPKAQVRVVWTKTWYDPPMEKEAAKSLLDLGADVIAQHQNSPGPQQAAEERGKYSIGYNSDMSAFAPKDHLVSAVWNWTPFYMEVISQIQAGTWRSGSYWPGMAQGIVGLSAYGPMVPDEVKKVVEERRQAITSGSADVFTGPIKDQSGAVRVAEGQRMSDKEMLSMDWFVEGVTGDPK